jgi:threonine dehydrogenase-like Zn-dependent dehydrogenase
LNNKRIGLKMKMEKYQKDLTVPAKVWAWNMYAAGTEHIGRNGKPELVDLPEPGDDQLLVRVDAVGLCFSDVKLIRLGNQHPKILNRDLANNPTRVGHEAALTVIKVGKALADGYKPGQRLVTAYGYTIPGGLIQFHLIGPEILQADAGSYVIPFDGQVSYAEAALTEPWACVDAAYTQRRRLTPKKGGTMWILGDLQDETPYSFSKGLDAPARIFLTNVSESLKDLINSNALPDAHVFETEALTPDQFQEFSNEMTDGAGFDDIILLASRSGELVTEAAKLIAFRGLMNIVGEEPLDGDSQIDAGRIHYHYTAYVGTNDTDIAAAYGEVRNRCELMPGGTALFVGAGGPMGQMHVQRAIEKKDGPAVIVASEVNPERAAVLQKIAAPLAEQNHKRFELYNPTAEDGSLQDFLEEKTGKRLVDDTVVCAPIVQLMEEAAGVLNPEGMLVLFAGVPIGTFMKVNFNDVFLHNQQFTGTSGSTIDDQKMILTKTLNGELNPNRSVAAIGGMEVAREGLEALINGTYAGKIVIFPQISGLPLIGLHELKDRYPAIAEGLGENELWTLDAEKALFEQFWKEH